MYDDSQIINGCRPMTAGDDRGRKYTVNGRDGSQHCPGLDRTEPYPRLGSSGLVHSLSNIPTTTCPALQSWHVIFKLKDWKRKKPLILLSSLGRLSGSVIRCRCSRKGSPSPLRLCFAPGNGCFPPPKKLRETSELRLCCSSC